jgi:hypothetical protein
VRSKQFPPPGTCSLQAPYALNYGCPAVDSPSRQKISKLKIHRYQGELGEGYPMNNTRKATVTGLTAIELLLITSVIAVITVFATPIVSSVFFDSDLDKAEDITEESIKKARLAARLYNSDVTMRISASGELARHGITITIPRASKDQLLGDVKEEFSLPVTVKVVSGDMLINFNADGEVDFPTMVMLATNEGNFEQREFVVE